MYKYEIDAVKAKEIYDNSTHKTELEKRSTRRMEILFKKISECSTNKITKFTIDEAIGIDSYTGEEINYLIKLGYVISPISFIGRGG